MRVLMNIRRHLGWKLLITYLIIIVVMGIVFFTAAEVLMPAAFENHLATMTSESGNSTVLKADLYASFRTAMVESLTRAMPVAVILALGLSLYMSRKVVFPIQRMQTAAQRIANGNYEERVEISAGREPDEIGQLAVHFNHMAASLESTEKMRYELIGNVSHELRTPLTSIKGYMEGLMDGVVPADEATYERIYREADRLQRLVADLQELSRVEGGAIKLNLKPVSAAAIIDGTLKRLSPQFQDKGVGITTDIAPGLLAMRADEDRIYQVLVNLVGNALSYTPSGGEVVIQARLKEPYIQISVSDNGIGIEQQHLQRLFDRFYRVDPSRNRVAGGSGIGLTIAKYLVEAHGGQITASSAGPGQGSTFSFSIPTA